MLGQTKSSSALLCRQLLIGAGLLVTLCGCGFDLYEERLQATKKFYEHVQILDDNLTRDWSNGVVSIRVPAQFAEIPAPAPPAPPDPANPTVAPAEPAKDERKPDYTTLELNGLKAAFKADLRLDGGTQKPGFIYVLSNHDFPNRDAAKEFRKQLVQELSNAFNVTIEKWEEEQFPNKPSEMFPGARYQSITVTPAQDIGGFPRRISIYLNTNGEVETAIVFVLPQKIDGTERLTERTPLCLETLSVSSDHIEVPGQAPAGDTGGAAGTPAAGKGGF